MDDWLLTKIAPGLELVKRLDQPAGRVEFYRQLLEVAAPLNVESISCGLIPPEFQASQPSLCDEIEIAPRLPKVGNSPAALGLFGQQPETRFFARDPQGALLFWSHDGDGSSDHWGPGKGLAFPRITDERGAYGLCFFGSKLVTDMAAKRTLSFIASYSFARILLVQRLGAPPQLSDRQIEVLQWAAEGKTDHEIARILGVSEHTIDKYMRRSKEALNAVNRTGVIVQAMRHGLIA